MKIGIMNFEAAPAGLNQLFEKLIPALEIEHTVQVVKAAGNGSDLQVIELEKESNETIPSSENKTVPLSPLHLETSLYQSLNQFDKVIIVGTNPFLPLIKELKKELPETDFLFLPVSMYNDIDDSEGSLGYDTALNYIIESVLKIKDTIDSLKYPNPRLFGIQLSGKASPILLKEAAQALGSYPIFSNWKGFDADTFTEKTQNVFSSGQTYYFVLFDSTVNPDEIPKALHEDLNVDWKWGQIDESLCGGPYPTAQDRLIAMQFAEEAIEWIEKSKPTGRLIINNRNSIFQAL